MKAALISLLVWGCCVSSAWADESVVDKTERQRIATQRAEARAVFTRAENECRQRFAATACIDAARRQQRESLASLRREEAVLDEAQRKQRAAARIEAIRSRLNADAAEQHEAPPRRAPKQRAEPPAVPSAPASAPPSASSTPRAAVAASAVAPKADTHETARREADEARSRARFDARRAQMEQHRQAVEQRERERAAHAKPAAPLPTASAAAH